MALWVDVVATLKPDDNGRRLAIPSIASISGHGSNANQLISGVGLTKMYDQLLLTFDR